MPRYIDADILTAEFKRSAVGEISFIQNVFNGICKAIDSVPTADVVPREEAEWVFISPYYPYESSKYRCSRCKSEIRADEKYKIKFCFSCGARMKGE